jgi:hypothetical protein
MLMVIQFMQLLMQEHFSLATQQLYSQTRIVVLLAVTNISCFFS